MCDCDNKYDKNFIDKFVKVLNWYNARIHPIRDTTFIVWDIDSGKIRGKINVNLTKCVSITPSGSMGLTCHSKIVTLWDLNRLSKITDIARDSGHDYSNNSAVFSPDGSKFVISMTSNGQGVLRIYDSEGRPLGDEFNYRDSRNLGLWWFSDNNRLLTIDVDTLSVIDSTNGKVLVTKKFPDEIYINNANVSPDDSKIAIVGHIRSSSGTMEKGLVQVFTEADLSLIRSLELGDRAESVTFNNNNDRILFTLYMSMTELSCNNFPIVSWNYVDNIIDDRLFGGHQNIARSLTRCRTNSDHFFSGGDDMKVFFWNAKSGQVIKNLKGHTSRVVCVDISADCKVGISCEIGLPDVTEQMVRQVLEKKSRIIQEKMIQ